MQKGVEAKMPNSVRAVERVFHILRCFDLAENSLSLAVISKATGLAPSTVSRLLSCLVSIGVLARNEDRSFSIGRELYMLGTAITSHFVPRMVAYPYMKDLRDETKETVTLYGIDRGYRVCYEHIPGTLTHRCSVRVGEKLPLWAGAAGKVLLAYADEDTVERETDKLAKITDATITDRETLMGDLASIKCRDFSVSRGERDDGILSVAVPIFDRDGRSPLCISLSAPAARLDDTRVTNVARRMQEISARITRELNEYEFEV